ncbi:MAG: arginase family protein [Desulfomonile tiedjei]|uniref:Arginase family protein n=1 Tax=Desulfomonile tiedjei TaxID=2358 RepID=A0A9D6Z1J4_9BACT|nr:arginase family protein [Desulfomonile tiedjei]
MTGKVSNRRPIFFGCALDPDERDESIQEKIRLSGTDSQKDDPYSEIMRLVRQELAPDTWEERGVIEVPPWLRPIPPSIARKDVTLDNFVHFIDGNGCRDFAEAAGKFVEECIFPEIPCMIGIDHSLTGGVFASLVSFYRPDDISLIIVDSHVDSLPTSAMSGAIQYDVATNPNSVHDSNDPFLRNRSDSYNASSFLHYLLEDAVIDPENLYLIGVSDYPAKRAFRIKDDRIRRYVDCYSSLKKNGAKILTKKDLSFGSTALSNLIRRVRTPYVYISIDMDIGARNALGGVRFQNYQGITENRIYKIAKYLRELLDRDVNLAGMDVMEFNPRRAGSGETQSDDRTYRIAFNLIKTICFQQKKP